jgi:hypothetical protein
MNVNQWNPSGFCAHVPDCILQLLSACYTIILHTLPPSEVCFVQTTYMLDVGGMVEKACVSKTSISTCKLVYKL